MARLARVQVFAPDEIAFVHLMNRAFGEKVAGRESKVETTMPAIVDRRTGATSYCLLCRVSI